MMHLTRQKTALMWLCLLGITTGYTSALPAKELISPQCEPLVVSQSVEKDIPYSRGLLWKISKHNNDESSYLFGTIHVSDEDITTLPAVVDQALHDSEQFVMEALPDAEQTLIFSRMMFFNDGHLLSELVDSAIFNRTQSILSAYKLGSNAVSVMKPWAAFLLMNYPPDEGEPLDMVLLSLAQENGASVAGLETIREQAEIFNDLNIDEQVKLLTDAVCHYDVVEEDFTAMKSFYLKRDLGGLYNYTQRHSMNHEPVYKKLMQKLIIDRNLTMVKRMQPMLDKGNSFIAIGALHLTGKQGVLALLEQQGYTVSVIF
jgi:uncharacterized protein YbaP (TraB family)